MRLVAVDAECGEQPRLYVPLTPQRTGRRILWGTVEWWYRDMPFATSFPVFGRSILRLLYALARS